MANNVISLRLLGADKVLKAMNEVGPRADRALGAGLYLAGNNIMSESKDLVPVDTGALKGSGYVTLPEVSRGRIVVECGYGGGGTKNYAIVQHEHTEYRHDHGQAKYLEQPVNAAAASFSHDVAALARAAFEANTGATRGPIPTTPWEGGAE